MRRSRAAAVGTVAGVALLVGGCMRAPATTQGQDIANLYAVFLGGALIVAAIVYGLVTWSILRYRHHARPNEPVPPQTRENIVLEMIWTTLPILTVLGLFALTYITIDRVQARSPQPGVDVHVEAFQWQWRFTYPASGVVVTGQIGQPPQLVVPVGQPIHVLLTADDVIHAFYVQSFLFKRDAIPGHPNTFDFTVMNPGIYGGQCAEFCGVFHDRMTFSVRAVTADEFASWLASARAGAQASEGSGGSGTSAAPGAPGSATPAPSAAAGSAPPAASASASPAASAASPAASASPS